MGLLPFIILKLGKAFEFKKKELINNCVVEWFLPTTVYLNH
jgi:hypothetical protein